jgi:hypothetical protein
MGKLHEVLAVEGDLAGVAKKVVDEATVTFSKRADHFLESATKLEYFSAEDAHLNNTESKAMVTTVFDKLKYIVDPVSKFYDAYYVKGATNQIAQSDVTLNGKVLFSNVPVSVLLGMETKLKELRKMYESIPTLAPGVFWEKDPTKNPGIYRNREDETRLVTKKNIRPIVMAPATDKHPAQIEKVSEDMPVATKKVSNWSGMLSPSDKSKLLQRIDDLIRAVKAARQKGNSTDAVDASGFGKGIFDFIHDGIVE